MPPLQRSELYGHERRFPNSPARYGRAHPFGQPVMRMTMESFLRPFSSHIFSTLSMRIGRYYYDKVSCEFLISRWGTLLSPILPSPTHKWGTQHMRNLRAAGLRTESCPTYIFSKAL